MDFASDFDGECACLVPVVVVPEGDEIVFEGVLEPGVGLVVDKGVMVDDAVGVAESDGASVGLEEVVMDVEVAAFEVDVEGAAGSGAVFEDVAGDFDTAAFVDFHAKAGVAAEDGVVEYVV